MTEDQDRDENGIFRVIGPKFLERFRSGKRTEVGYVKDVTENENGTFVNWTNTHGEPGTFVFDKKLPRFKEAPNGFMQGDYIKMEINGARIISARPLKLNRNEKEELANQFKSIGEDG